MSSLNLKTTVYVTAAALLWNVQSCAAFCPSITKFPIHITALNAQASAPNDGPFSMGRISIEEGTQMINDAKAKAKSSGKKIVDSNNILSETEIDDIFKQTKAEKDAAKKGINGIVKKFNLMKNDATDKPATAKPDKAISTVSAVASESETKPVSSSSNRFQFGNLAKLFNSEFINSKESTTSLSATTAAAKTSVDTFVTSLQTPIEKLKTRKAKLDAKTDTKALKNEQEVVVNDITGFETRIPKTKLPSIMKKETTFTFEQRIDSTKAGLVGLFAGGFALAPLSFLHNVLFADDSIANGMAQWEFDTDTGSLQAALFAIVYRYCVREGEETNEMLLMGVVAAFSVVRTFSKIRVPTYCTSAPLDCGDPFGYFDWAMVQQALLSGTESFVMFGSAVLAMEFVIKKGYIARLK